jgi:cell division protein FtsB
MSEQRRAHRQPAESPRRRRRALWVLLTSITVVGVLFIGVYPTRTYFAQRASLRRAQHQIDVLQTQNDKLSDQADQLNTDGEIERLARERYNLVRPGEQAFAILPAPPAPIELPAVWPFTGLAQKLAPSGTQG